MTEHITIRSPDDWHCHLRDGDALACTVPDQSRYFSRSIVMPNLVNPITTVDQAVAYQSRIAAHVPHGRDFLPLMTLYLNDAMTPATLQQAKASNCVHAVKLYPAGATTHSAAGVTDIGRMAPALAAMEALSLPLLVHGEVTDDECDIFDREARFIDHYLLKIMADFPKLRIVMEHITTRYAVDFIQSAPDTLAATITPHHLLLNRNDLLVGGLKPHHYCLPVLKRSEDQDALIQAAISGNPKFFLGTDSAPHEQSQKLSACGCAGIYSAHAALEFYAGVFEHHGALDRLENFASVFGAQFYQLPLNSGSITLVRSSWRVPTQLNYAGGALIPLFAGQPLQWSVVRSEERST